MDGPWKTRKRLMCGVRYSANQRWHFFFFLKSSPRRVDRYNGLPSTQTIKSQYPPHRPTLDTCPLHHPTCNNTLIIPNTHAPPTRLPHHLVSSNLSSTPQSVCIPVLEGCRPPISTPLKTTFPNLLCVCVCLCAHPPPLSQSPPPFNPSPLPATYLQ